LVQARLFVEKLVEEIQQATALAKQVVVLLEIEENVL
jgi:hypothetical protein